MPWTKTRQILESDLLCDSLKGRVRYYVTRYRHAHDGTGRVCILVDKQEVINMPCENEDKIFAEAHERFEGSGKSLFQLSEVIAYEYHERGDFRPYDFGSAVDIYLSQPIGDSLSSNNFLVKMLAVLDRRIGKRTLKKIIVDMSVLPEWLQYFYKLRLEAENMLHLT